MFDTFKSAVENFFTPVLDYEILKTNTAYILTVKGNFIKKHKVRAFLDEEHSKIIIQHPKFNKSFDVDLTKYDKHTIKATTYHTSPQDLHISMDITNEPIKNSLKELPIDYDREIEN